MIYQKPLVELPKNMPFIAVAFAFEGGKKEVNKRNNIYEEFYVYSVTSVNYV